jgi:iron complex transport system substrate-binding protein
MRAQMSATSRWRLIALAVSALLAGGCGVAAGTTPSTTDDPAVGNDSSPHGRDPRAIAGPSTAVLADGDIEPIAVAPTPRLPITVHSFDDTEVTITSTDRIIAVDMSGTLAEIVFTLGLGSHVVGRDMSTDFPAAQGIPVVTVGGHNLSAEAILGLDPTVVLTDSEIGPAHVPGQLRDAGVPVVFFDPARTLEGVPGLIYAVAAALGVPDAGAALVQRVRAQIDSALAMAPDDPTPLRMAFLYVRGSAGVYLMGGRGSGADAMIKAIGGVDVGTELGLSDAFVPITSESLIAGPPDVIIVMTKGLESVGGVDGLLQIPGLAQTPAGEHRRVVDMDDGTLLSFGPRVGSIIGALARAVYDPSGAA